MYKKRIKLIKDTRFGVIALAKGQVESAKECRQNHIKQLAGKLKSAIDWLKKSQKKLKDALTFYQNKELAK